jgi:putative transposase
MAKRKKSIATPRPRKKRTGWERIFEVRLYPTAAQEERFRSILWLCANVWNAALSERKGAYERYKRFGMRADFVADWPTYQSQYDQLIALRDEYAWIDGDVYAETLAEVLKRLDNAMRRFVARKTSGENAGFPRFRPWRRFKTFTILHAMRCLVIDADNGRFSLKSMRGLGGVKWRAGKRRKQLPDVIANVKISLRQGKWYAYFQHEIDPEVRAAELAERNGRVRSNRAKSSNVVGVDFGIAHAAATSDGKLIANPRFQRTYADDVTNAQREMSRLRPKRGQKSSTPYKRVCAAFGRRSAQIARVRRDWQHKVSRKLVDTHSWFVFEDLRLDNMTKSARGTVEEPGKNVAQKAGLNRSILDVAPGQFRDMVRGKAVEAGGGLLVVNPAYTSQTCSTCAHVDRNSRIERGRFVCTRCGFNIHADVNAGRNLRLRGLAALKPSTRDATAACAIRCQ